MDLTESNQNSGAGFVAQINHDQQEQSAQEKSRELGLGYVNLKNQSINLDSLKLLSQEEAKNLGAIIFDKLGKKLSIAFYNPLKKEEINKNLTEKGFICDFYLSSRIGFDEALETYKSDYFHKKKIEIREKVDEKEKVFEAHLQDFEKLEETINTMPSESAIAEILLLSVAARASDIHFQPEKSGVVLRLRIDGVLHNVLKIKENPAKKIVMGIKYMSGMRSNILDVPQDGNIIKEINQRSVDLRISTLPTTKGIESVVIRILDSSRGIKSFSDLGFSEHVEKKILKSLYQRKNGIVLVTGPTGSGKTTTLYSMLAELNSPERKLVTLEDPIEYHLEGVSQSQVNEDRNFNFETGFKSLLRHDPDVILVGEVRTVNTAKLAFEAALTGHTVMTSLHANSSVGAISRLRNMGVKDYNIAPTISAVFAQKLIRKLCPHCKKIKEYDLDKYNLKASINRIKKILPKTNIPLVTENSAKFYSAVGCEKCSQTGFSEQTAICEAFLITDKIREMILNKDSEVQITEFLKKQTDFLSIFEDGLLKVFTGETSLEELNRIVGL